MGEAFLHQNANIGSVVPSATVTTVNRNVQAIIPLADYSLFYVCFVFVRSTDWSGWGFSTYLADVTKATFNVLAQNYTLAQIRATAVLSGSSLIVNQDWSNYGLGVIVMPVK